MMKVYAFVAGFIGAILALVFVSFFPVCVQSQSNTFGEITCTGLKMVNTESKCQYLDMDGKSRKPRAVMGVNEYENGAIGRWGKNSNRLE